MITIFTGPGCGGCITTKAHFRKRGVPFDEIRLDQNPDWAERLKEHGFSSVPVVLVGDEDVWSGYSSDAVEEWAEIMAETA